MNIKILQKFDALYILAKKMGSDNILRSFLELDQEVPLPLSISHGVDMNHLIYAQDVLSVEPIHWCYNNEIFDRASQIKSSVKLPHPWIILINSMNSTNSKKKLLIIGPPAGMTNDQNLLKSLSENNIHEGDILIKKRGEIDQSESFWIEEGFGVVSAGESDSGFYMRLFEILSEYESIISCSMSSALIFAAALGKECGVLDNYHMSTYELEDYTNFINFHESVGRQFLEIMINGSSGDLQNFSQVLLGIEFMDNQKFLKDKLMSSFIDLDSPFYYSKKTFLPTQKFMEFAALKLNKPSLLNVSIKNIIKKFSNPKISIISKNEISIYKNGISQENFISHSTPYIAGLTEPGRAID